jgi:hypothetical protein
VIRGDLNAKAGKRASPAWARPLLRGAAGASPVRCCSWEAKPLYARKTEVKDTLTAKGRERQRLAEALQALEHREAEQIAVLGAAWDPAEYRQLKHDLDEADREERLMAAGVVTLEEKIDALHAEVRADIERRMNGLRLPLVQQVVAALDSITAANRALHGIEGLSQRLLGFAKWHLVDPSLEPRLALTKRSLPLLRPAPADPGA